jgi:hypothetical protein
MLLPVILCIPTYTYHTHLYMCAYTIHTHKCRSSRNLDTSLFFYWSANGKTSKFKFIPLFIVYCKFNGPPTSRAYKLSRPYNSRDSGAYFSVWLLVRNPAGSGCRASFEPQNATDCDWTGFACGTVLSSIPTLFMHNVFVCIHTHMRLYVCLWVCVSMYSSIYMDE